MDVKALARKLAPRIGEPSPSERRTSGRTASGGRLVVAVQGGRRIRGQVLDVSRGGIAFRVPGYVPAGQVADVTYFGPGSRVHRFVQVIRWVWDREGYLVGARFTGEPPEALRHLRGGTSDSPAEAEWAETLADLGPDRPEPPFWLALLDGLFLGLAHRQGF